MHHVYVIFVRFTAPQRMGTYLLDSCLIATHTSKCTHRRSTRAVRHATVVSCNSTAEGTGSYLAGNDFIIKILIGPSQGPYGPIGNRVCHVAGLISALIMHQDPS